jgi:hypothetical protein
VRNFGPGPRQASIDAEAAFDASIESYRVKYEKEAECLNKNHNVLLDFLRLPR